MAGKSTVGGGRKNFEKISKIELSMFDEIEDPEERERMFFETIERMKKTVEDLHLKVSRTVRFVGSNECEEDPETERRQRRIEGEVG